MPLSLPLLSCHSQLTHTLSFSGCRLCPPCDTWQSPALEHSLGLVRRPGLVDQLELSGKAVGAGVFQQATHRVGVQVSDELANPPDLVGHRRFQVVKRFCIGTYGLKEN